MREFTEILTERGDEIDKHLAFIKELSDRAVGRGGDSGHPVDVEHVNILKSGFLIHLYNVVESVMAKVLEEVAENAKQHSPTDWCDGLLREWARGRAGFGKDINNDKRLSRIYDMLAETSGRSPLQAVRIPAESGNWTDENVAKMAKFLGCDLAVDDPVRIAACEAVFENDMGPLKYVRHKRNRLAHGNESFRSAASHLTPERLDQLRSPVINYMRAVAYSFEQYLDGRCFLRAK